MYIVSTFFKIINSLGPLFQKIVILLFVLTTLALCYVNSKAFAEDTSLPDDQIPIVETNKWVLTFGDIKRIISYYPKEQREQLLANPKNIVNLAERLLQAKVLSDEAYKEGFDSRPDIKEQLDLFVRDRLATAYLREKVINSIDITDQDVAEYYRAHKEKYQLKPRAKVRHILIRLPKNPKQSEIKQAEQRIKDILAKLDQGESFDVLARMYSEDPGSRDKGGDLGWIIEDQVDPSFAKAVFSAKLNKPVGPVRSAFGLHIIKVEARKEKEQLPLDRVKEQVRAELFDKIKAAKIHQFMQSEMEKANAKVNREKLIELLLK